MIPCLFCQLRCVLEACESVTVTVLKKKLAAILNIFWEWLKWQVCPQTNFRCGKHVFCSCWRRYELSVSGKSIFVGPGKKLWVTLRSEKTFFNGSSFLPALRHLACEFLCVPKDIQSISTLCAVAGICLWYSQRFGWHPSCLRCRWLLSKVWATLSCALVFFSVYFKCPDAKLFILMWGTRQTIRCSLIVEWN